MSIVVRSRYFVRSSCTAPIKNYLYQMAPVITSKYFTDRFTLCFIDVGIKNLGLVVFSVDRHWSNPSLDYFERVDLTVLDKSLTPYTTNELSDRVERFTTLYKERLDSCEKLFIERQPFSGIKVVEQFLYKKYIEKAVLVSPISFQTFFKFGSKQGFDYASRKQKSIVVAQHAIDAYGNEEVQRKWKRMKTQKEKLDDISDPIVMGLFVIQKKRAEWEENYSQFI